MRTYILYIIWLAVLVSVLAASIHARLLWPSIALAVALLWLCLSLYGRISRLLYAYRETEKENERLHARIAEAERQLQYLRQLTENVDTALFVCSTDGRIDWMNHAAKAFQTPRPPLGGEGTHLYGEGTLPDNILKAIAEHEEVVDGCALYTTLLTIDGRRRLIVAMKDVSLLMQRQEMEAWQQLIRVLTHEIMNSLTPIISISETLSSPLPTSPRGGESSAFEVINRRCHALLDFVESYRQLTRIKAPEKTTFPVAELFEHMKALFKDPPTPFRGRGISLSIDEGQGVSLHADRSQIEQVLINLIKNAYESGATEVELTAPSPLPLWGSATIPLARRFKALPQRGSGEGAVGSGVTLLVRDNGCGMSPDVLAHAFIPFFTTKPAGTGIGLSLCRQIILKHGGTISIDSQEGRGTTFTITLPKA